MTPEQHLQEIEAFSRRYRYDMDYLKEFLHASPKGYEKFANFRPLSHHREFLSADIYWVSKLAAMQVADCGACLQLSVRMALEAGLDKSLVQACLQGGSHLPDKLKDIFDFATAVAGHQDIDPQLEERIDTILEKRQRIELGVCVATASVYPTIKRAMGYAQSCCLLDVDFSV
ncbi:hypothetical protein [Microbulbifer thermotolerans]|uniref:Carboxymuconolactone decarboxylase-like domain-containing protein n=1 Tax=Microbulbifer thermotolerans TaxID=252514 RepID=A0A143HI75_MICTH|nr:hypothetical protein [Microbulbifer thermotolerans]AMX01206.1 hypothetical protein A3224_00175 [Microbulbifer thermotolerans]MCX2778478.1 hypothetical protein [Microbulbifer thermotolerans]MCX2783949.1 hypothetical protein [Microbulbifer thermotolerans]MCX2793962.1 hypothetical protein [Microbulbifer thermotolerans]MCX2801666.1 hypothetical protein [Microbulbifer thermotolerans]